MNAERVTGRDVKPPQHLDPQSAERSIPQPAWPMLGQAGLTGQALSTYRGLLELGESDVVELAARLARPRAHVHAALGLLAGAGLIRRGDGNACWRAVSPEIGLRALRNAREIDLLRRREELARLDAEIDAFVAESSSTPALTAGIERLDGASATLVRVEELLAATRHSVEVLVDTKMSPRALAHAWQHDARALRRGVRIRAVYAHNVLQNRDNRAYLERLAANGAHIRTRVSVPLRAIVFDRNRLVVRREPENPEAGAVVVREPGVVAVAVALFEEEWDRSLPFRADGDADAVRDEIGEPELAVLRLLMRGETDAAVARRLAVSDRTVRRLIANLYGLAGVRGRFELGAVAAARGWLSADSLPDKPLSPSPDQRDRP